jgi:hypothetical protein
LLKWQGLIFRALDLAIVSEYLTVIGQIKKKTEE